MPAKEEKMAAAEGTAKWSKKPVKGLFQPILGPHTANVDRLTVRTAGATHGLGIRLGPAMHIRYRRVSGLTCVLGGQSTAVSGSRPARLFGRRYLFRGSQVGFGELNVLFRARHLALMALLKSFIHCGSPIVNNRSRGQSGSECRTLVNPASRW